MTENVRQLVYVRYFSITEAVPEKHECEKAEIVFSWLEKYQDYVNYLDVAKAVDFDDCCRLISHYIINSTVDGKFILR